jgi:hypothetical protein
MQFSLFVLADVWRLSEGAVNRQSSGQSAREKKTQTRPNDNADEYAC